jgi:hypothetical protein
LQIGDLLLSYGGQKLTSTDQATALADDSTLGSLRILTVGRAGKNFSLEVPAGRLGIDLAVVSAEAQAK